MLYKTIVLALLQETPLIYDQLLKHRTLLPTLEQYAAELRTHHHAWQDRLLLAKPSSDPRQIASAALEMALAELEERLPSGSRPDAMQPLSLDGALAFLNRPLPPA
jgi:hypothetical protein